MSKLTAITIKVDFFRRIFRNSNLTKDFIIFTPFILHIITEMVQEQIFKARFDVAGIWRRSLILYNTQSNLITLVMQVDNTKISAVFCSVPFSHHDLPHFSLYTFRNGFHWPLE